MKLSRFFLPLSLAGLMASALWAQEGGGDGSRKLRPEDKRGALVDRFEKVRGDTGKWRDERLLQVAPAMSRKPEKLPLDDWADQLLEKPVPLMAGEESWLIFRTQQLDDNDRLWIESIERKGSEIIVVMSEAIWQGYYSKTFTWYGVLGVNLGKLPAGDFQVKWIVKPLEFEQFEDPRDRRNSCPKGEKPAAEEASSETLAFSVSEK